MHAIEGHEEWLKSIDKNIANINGYLHGQREPAAERSTHGEVTTASSRMEARRTSSCMLSTREKASPRTSRTTGSLTNTRAYAWCFMAYYPATGDELPVTDWGDAL